MRVPRRGARLSRCSFFRGDCGGLLFEDNIGDTGGPLRDLRGGPRGASRRLIHTQILRIDALSTPDVPARYRNDTVSPCSLSEGVERIFRVPLAPLPALLVPC